ncbi:MAG TPA: type II secretion system protein [Candidatus Paceibacterota bacterium]|nr:type II secretion system protein [Candidatus Paceibacterota bacterium]
MKENSSQSGFTLIETIIYIALFAIIISGAIVSIYGIIGASSRNQIKAMVEEEGSFLVGKIDWALSGAANAEVVNTPSDSTLETTQYDGKEIWIRVSAGDMSIDPDYDGTTYNGENLNNSNVTITCPASSCFTYTAGSSDGINPARIVADFTLSTRTAEGLSYSQEFSTIKYLRK